MQAPRGASKVITIRAEEGTSVNVSKLPNDLKLHSDFDVLYSSARAAATIPEDSPGVDYVRWINNAIHISFQSPPHDGTVPICEEFWRQCPGLQEAIPVASKFRFRNGVLYRRVPFIDPAAATSAESIQALKRSILKQPAWAGITLAGNPRVSLQEGSTFGNVFIDFYDNSRSSAMRQVMREVIYLNEATCRAVQAQNFRPATPRCSICQRWGHPAQICRSPVVRCPVCAGAHDERNHNTTAGDSPISCFNCKGNHRSDSVVCPYFTNRRDKAWIQSKQPSANGRQNPPQGNGARQNHPNVRLGMGRQGPNRI